jgi:membrane protein YqaA with SNARE-associated domain
VHSDIKTGVITILLQAARKPYGGFTAVLRHLGVFGLFFLAIVDSFPLPTFGGPDILIAILAARHGNPWYEYAAIATAGSLLGAFITFSLARQAGITYLQSKFGSARAPTILKIFERHGTGALAATTAIPFPLPTSVFFAAAGASNYPARKFLTVTGLCRALRYSLIAIIADRYGRHFMRVIRHPTQYWGWLLFFAVIMAAIVALGIVINRSLGTTSSAG